VAPPERPRHPADQRPGRRGAGGALAAEIVRRAEELLRQPVGEAAAVETVTAPEAPPAPASASSPPEPNGPDAAAGAILTFLVHNPGWHGRQEIVTATGTDDEWRGAIDTLLERGLALKRGAKRGTQYCAAPAATPSASRTATPDVAPGVALTPGAASTAIGRPDDHAIEAEGAARGKPYAARPSRAPPCQPRSGA
jgi:hypothetical protein